MTLPTRQPGESFEDHQAAVARWMGMASAAQMNADHDSLHRSLCRWLGVESHSMLCAEGKPHDAALAAIEEAAVLHLQRMPCHHGAGVPA